MTNIRRIDYSSNEEISAIVTDSANDALWLSYKKNASDNCILKRVSAFDPNQTYYTVEIQVEEIPRLIVSGSVIYCLYDSSTLIGAKYSTTNPLSTSTDFDLPESVVETPVDFTFDGTYLYYLIPGAISGQNASIVKLTSSGTYVETIDLLKSGNIVLNASTITVDSSDDLWVGTYTSPANLVRVFDIGGGDWDFTITQLG